VNSIGKSRRCRFVDQPVYSETCQLAGAPGGLALLVVKVRRHSDDRRIDGLVKMMFGISFDARKYQSRELLGQKFSFT
jgi:hypothetical protein